jgi:hypothetical protein
VCWALAFDVLVGPQVSAHILGWVLTGAVTAVVAPGLLLLTRGRLPWHRMAVPAAVSAPGFVVLHAGITAALVLRPSLEVWLLLHALLLAGSIVYWLPILGDARRLSGAGRCLYLFLSSPLLDFAALGVIVLGDPSGGLAMIVAMLPINAAAVGATWQWIVGEERVAREADDPRLGPGPPWGVR